MKRNEAINLMINFNIAAKKRFSHLTDFELMDGILLQLEKEGMLPPAHPYKNAGPNDITMLCKWEPENE